MESRHRRPGACALGALLGIAAVAAILPVQTARAARQPAARRAAANAGEAAAAVQCAACHAVPPPDVLPRGAWRDEIARMFLIREHQPEPIGPPGTAARMVGLPREWTEIVRYYEAAAPAELPAPEPWPAPDGRLAFARRPLTLQDGARPDPAVSHVRFLDVDGDPRLEVVAADMRHGLVMIGRPYDAQPSLRVVARVPSPAHVEQVDFDRDGVRDLVVADLGEFVPRDHAKGAVVWLRGRPDGTFVPLRLEGWPRVADVEAADFDGDGRLDLAVAAFGWRTTGDLTVLKNDTTDYARPAFSRVAIDPRTGAIHTPPVDLNGDGRPDLVALFAQEHETIVAFLNTGRSAIGFEPQTIYTAPHPNWGSSGIQVVDMDGDGDLDVLYTHGDTFDDKILKPYQGIQWLENRGAYPFTMHQVANMAGVFRAQAADMDRDGDLDIVACALVSTADVHGLPALVWLEQVKPGVFDRHTLEVGVPLHATLDVGDFDRDGDMDLVVGNFTFGPPVPSPLELWDHR